MITNNSILATIETGLFFSLLAFLSERVLIHYGVVRGNTIFLVIMAFSVAFIRQTLDAESNLLYYYLFVLIVGPLSANRVDIITSIEKGRWWWKSKDENKNNSI